jgi:RAB6A-GEF complex partner protein 2
VEQLSAHLETHEALPTALASPPRPNTPVARQLKRVHAEHHSAFVLSTLRTTFSLDIPSDGSAAFQIKVGGNEEKTGSQSQSANVVSPDPHSPLPPNSPMHRAPASAPAYPSTFPSSPSPFSVAFSPSYLSSPSTFPIPPNSKPGGLEWKVRLCLLVAVASEDADPGTEDVKVKGLVRDEFDDFNDDGYGRIGRGYRGRGGDKGRGEWGSSWKAVTGVGLEKVKSKNTDKAAQASQNQNERSQNQQNQNQGMVRSWASFLASSILGSGDDTVDEDEDDSDIDGLEGPPIYDGIKPDRAGGVGVGVEYGNDSKWFGEALSPSSPNPGDDGDDGQQRRTRVRGEWRELKVETVECEVPIRVWPGNTAYKPVDVVFDV